ncbi:hypothetical protein DSO57_1003914 [Entomophthora muscae]|uniref:Uncharacterized protein n=1 Tax=Entomophthora muscae TaxID=34485 RepID=A0ACC2SAU2_9FUNG|nr:hypothetical protein DSO57_1003914 [Entomophthora muscae]
MYRQELPNALLMQYPLSTLSWTNFPSLFKRVTVLKILEDYDDPKTRQESLQLTIHHPFFVDMGVSVVGISEQFVGIKDFVEYSGWKGDLYFDLYKNVCRAPSLTNSAKDQKPGILTALRRLNAQALFKLGGTYIVTPESKIIYAHEPKNADDSPRIGQMMKICFNLLNSTPLLKFPTLNSRKAKSLSIHRRKSYIRSSTISQ